MLVVLNTVRTSKLQAYHNAVLRFNALTVLPYHCRCTKAAPLRYKQFGHDAPFAQKLSQVRSGQLEPLVASEYFTLCHYALSRHFDHATGPIRAAPGSGDRHLTTIAQGLGFALSHVLYSLGSLQVVAAAKAYMQRLLL